MFLTYLHCLYPVCISLLKSLYVPALKILIRPDHVTINNCITVEAEPTELLLIHQASNEGY